MNDCGAEMPKYKCHKEVWALKISDISPVNPIDDTVALSFFDDGFADIEVDSLWVEKHQPDIGGYYVVYKDGYKSYSPADAFEGGYTAV